MRRLRLGPAAANPGRWPGLLTGALLVSTAVLESAQLPLPPPPPTAPAPAAELVVVPVEPAADDAAVQAPMELLASRPIVRVKVNGEGPYAFLIDPLAPRVLIDQTLAEALELKTQRSADDRDEALIDIGIGSATFRGIAAQVGKTSRLVPEFGPEGQPRGVLNTSVWPNDLVTIDFGRRRLRIEPGTLPEPDQKSIFALEMPAGDLVVPMVVNGQSLRCRIDPMAPHGLLLPSSSRAQVPLRQAPASVSGIGTGRPNAPAKDARVTTTVTIATFDFDQPIVEFGEAGDTAVVGSPWLAGFALTYDAANRRVRLEQTRVF